MARTNLPHLNPHVRFIPDISAKGLKDHKTNELSFVLSRLKRAGITKESLQTVGQKITELQIQTIGNETNIAKQVVC